MEGLGPKAKALFFLLHGSGCVDRGQHKGASRQLGVVNAMFLAPMVQWLKVLTVKPVDLSSVPRTYVGQVHFKPVIFHLAVPTVLAGIIFHLHIRVKGDRISELLG